MEEVVSYAALFFCLRVAWKSKQKRLRMRLRRKLNVYEFVTTTFSTWMNDNLHETTCKCMQTCKTSDQPTALCDNMQVILCLVCEQDSISLPTNKHFHPRTIKGREVWGGYSIIKHYLFLSCLLRSHFCVELQATRQHTQKKQRKWILPLYLSACPLQIVSPFRINRTHVWNWEKN